MNAGLVDPSRLTSDLVVSEDLEGHDQGGVLWDLQMSLACINSDGARSSRVRLFDDAKGFDPKGGDEGENTPRRG